MVRPIHGGNLDWAAKIAGCAPHEILDFSASINPLGIPLSAIALIHDNIDTLQHYPDPTYHKLRKALAKHHGVTSEQIVVGNGAAELLTWAAYEGSQLSYFYLPSPCFADYRRAVKTFEIPIKFYPLDTLEKGFNKDTRPSGLIINNPHNPTGKLWDKPTLQRHLNQFALVIIDEAFMDFIIPESAPSLIDLVTDYPNLIVVRSLTKFYAIPGLRLGYAITNPQRCQIWQQWRDPWSVNSFASLIGETMIQDREFQQKTYQWLTPARIALENALKQNSLFEPLPSAVNFLLVKTKIPSSQLQQKLLKQSQTLIRDCLSFPELGENFFRIAVRTPAENQQLIDALNIVNAP